MTVNMMGPSEHDYFKSYENAITQLQAAPDDRELQHQAVLALARIGSLDFALAEYERYGLVKIRHHEDIMALGGRLSKDLYLTASGKTAKAHALNAAQKYEAAYNDTQGYYSGVNSATMALLAGMPENMINDRARLIEQALPPIENLTPTHYYFIEATRAECFLLLGEHDNAHESLRRAFEFDPLNYTAHATTLKQFKLILNKQKASMNWLRGFSSPRPMHFAGHIWMDDGPPETPTYNDLIANISDAIQQNDIGYGYGSLAAGADILIAEQLIQEGAELHVILPSDKDSFIENSVRPFGDNWVPRFMACFQKAQSVKILSRASGNSQRDLDLLAGDVGMGQAILKSRQFDVEPMQLLLLDEKSKGSMTRQHAKKWQQNKCDQTLINVKIAAMEQRTPPLTPKELKILMMVSQSNETQTFTSLNAAIKAAKSRISDNKKNTVALSYNFDDAHSIVEKLTAKALPNSIFVTDEIAASLALIVHDPLNILYAGMIDTPNKDLRHIHTLRA